MQKINPIVKSITIETALKQYGKKNAKILNVGSGSTSYGRNCINLDIKKLPGVDIVADAHKMPVKSNSFDVIIICGSLCNFKNPYVVVKECYRVLKRGGIVICDAPFIMPYCGSRSSPDYYRFTKDGLMELFKEFKILLLTASISMPSVLPFFAQYFAKFIVSKNRFEALFANILAICFYPLHLLKSKQSETAGAYLIVGKKARQ